MKRHNRDSSPFRINVSFKDSLRQKLFSPSQRLLERLLLFHHLDRLYAETLRRKSGDHFLSKLLEQMNVTYKISNSDLSRIPRTGPAIVVANHPYGGIEAIIMCVLLKSVRPDAKVLANYFLNRIPEVHDTCIFVNPFKGKRSKKMNVAPLKETAKLVSGGGMLGIFPAGEVSHISLRGRGIVDPAWSASIGRIIRMTEAPVVPMFFEGHNGPFFQVAGLIHPRLRTAMLPHELLNKKNRCIRISVGSIIPYEKLRVYSSDSDMMEYLRFRSYVLGSRNEAFKTEKRRVFQARRKRVRKNEEIAPAEDPGLMSAEIEHVSAGGKLVESGDFAVFIAHAEQIRHVLYEIARLREVTFREEGEGTGKNRDLDRFDEYYLHMFVWNSAKKEVVGAYRLGCTDEILVRFGKKGLYTSTLFRYKRALLAQINPALELGRSFVRPEYQKDYSSLLLLWKGIGEFIARNPRYTKLFGPVSISNKYRSVSRWLLAAFLKYNRYESGLARFIKAKRPLRAKPIRGCATTIFDKAVKDVETISNVISEIESDHKGIPVLLKQYLKLGGKLLGLNMDPDFGDVLDGLVLVDLMQTDTRQIQRFMGKEGLKSFLEYHNRA